MAALRILLATDGSSGAGQALRLLTSSLEPDGVASVEVLSIVPRGAGFAPAGTSDADLTMLERGHREAAEQFVRAAAERLRAAGFAAGRLGRERAPRGAMRPAVAAAAAGVAAAALTAEAVTRRLRSSGARHS